MFKRFELVFLTVFCLQLNPLNAQNKFTDSFANTLRPSKDQMVINFTDSYNNKGHLPISIIKGATDGPVFTIVAGVHGYEYPPIVATQKVLQEIDPKKLSGTLIIIPIANTGSFYTRTPYINPHDKKNLNNAFPGKKDGTVTEKIADFITNNIIAESDVMLDIHGGDACEDLVPFVCYYNNEKKPDQTALAKKLSENSGFQYVVSYPYTISDDEPAKYAFKQAVQDGKTGLSIECGKLGNVQTENVSLIVKGVYNILASLEMYNAGSEEPHKNIVYRNNQTYVGANYSGIFYSDYKAGDTVEKGAIVGYTTDEFGTVLEEYTAPKNGIILYMLATPPINIDDTVMCISSLDD